LTVYGANGDVEPALASSWTETPLEEGGVEYVFTMREGVTFHDGAAWDCSVAKLNFDHVLAGGLRGGDWHGWYGLMDQIDTWECNEEGQLVMTTKDSYYPVLQELSFIRPLRMLSPLVGVGVDFELLSNSLTSNVETRNILRHLWTGPSLINTRATVVTRVGVPSQPMDLTT